MKVFIQCSYIFHLKDPNTQNVNFFTSHRRCLAIYPSEVEGNFSLSPSFALRIEVCNDELPMGETQKRKEGGQRKEKKERRSSHWTSSAYSQQRDDNELTN